MSGFTIANGGVIFSGGLATYFTPIYLFLNGEQGVWYDPSDITTLFQDSAGTIPVTGTDQPVGLIADKSSNNNDAIQANNSLRPNFEIWDDVSSLQFATNESLNISFPVSLGSNCTIGISLVNNDPVIVSNQTIGNTFQILLNNAGLVIINRQLTTAESGFLYNFLLTKGQQEYTVLGEYLSIKDSNATPANTFFATNSVNAGNNTGWTFL